MPPAQQDSNCSNKILKRGTQHSLSNTTHPPPPSLARFRSACAFSSPAFAFLFISLPSWALNGAPQDLLCDSCLGICLANTGQKRSTHSLQGSGCLGHMPGKYKTRTHVFKGRLYSDGNSTVRAKLLSMAIASSPDGTLGKNAFECGEEDSAEAMCSTPEDETNPLSYHQKITPREQGQQQARRQRRRQ